LGDGCKKAVVRGSARKEVEIMLGKSLGKEKNVFDTQITAEDSERGKHDPLSFMAALDKIEISSSESLILENAPLGVKAANKAGIQCIVLINNNTALTIEDFKSVIDDYRTLKDTRSALQLCEVGVMNARLCLGGVGDIAPRQNRLQNYQKMTDS
jgi:beta-phosphoglucomutase